MNEPKIDQNSSKFLDEDLQDVLNGVNTFFQKYNETRTKVMKIEGLNQALLTEIDLIKSNQLLEQSKSTKDLQVKLKKLSKKVRELEFELSETKDSHLKQLFQVEVDKDQVLQKIRMEVDEEKDHLKKSGLYQELSVQIAVLEAKLKSQADDFDDRSSGYEQKIQKYLKENARLESEISLMKEENERLCERIRKLEVSRLTHCPLSDEPEGSVSVAKSAKKSATKRKLFNPLSFDQ